MESHLDWILALVAGPNQKTLCNNALMNLTFTPFSFENYFFPIYVLVGRPLRPVSTFFVLI
jgi:hypothetical protein